MTDPLHDYDSCKRCHLPRFYHEDDLKTGHTTAELAGDCYAFVPNPSGWVYVTRSALNATYGIGISETPSDLAGA